MATEKLQVYRCNSCGNMVEVVRGGAGTLVCCGASMELLGANTTDAAEEKHVPVIEKVDGGVRVVVGSTAHPMQDDHYIEWIELVVDGKACRRFLGPGDAPEAVFPVEGAGQVVALAFCNLHGLWKGE